MTYRCNFCNLYFSGLPVFYRHRVGTGEDRRCLGEIELFHAGLISGLDWKFVGSKIIAPEDMKPRRRMIYEKPECMEKKHARWCFTHGVRPDKLVKSGLNAGLVCQVVNAEVRKIKSPLVDHQ